MKNLTAGEHNFTTDIESRAVISDISKSTISEKDLKKQLSDCNHIITNLLEKLNTTYEQYHSNELSTAINSSQMVKDNVDRIISRINEFGK